MSADFDVCIVGGGVVGLAIAQRLSEHCQVLLLERHGQIGTETSSRNSEVIHAGLYYPAASLKERLCVAGRKALYQFCEQQDVPHKRIGKLIVSPVQEHPALVQLQQTAQRLGIPLLQLDQTDISELEPAVTATAGLFSPSTGIIDSHQYMYRLQQLSEQQGALVACHSNLLSARDNDQGWQIAVETADGTLELQVRVLINAAGLSARQVALACGERPEHTPALYPCRGHYFSLPGRSPFHHLVYPLPEPQLAGLGVHATLDMGGQVRFGPDVQYLPGINEDPHWSPSSDNNLYHVDPQRAQAFATAIQRWYPQLGTDQLQPAYAGIRPKLSGPGQSVADFMLQNGHPDLPPALHLFGIESPGLTASLAIAEEVSTMLNMN
ncbi:NAD(P)/FAD-dependent oxidoreductase [Parathalassolituus penaei]|uniref:NAD(P)/FAD-dependent oxidoreductase n=1 Tax=Parathalassolituus penaei TaxID=2997323 RepID=A0A9X3EB12_9GAMM|nr:NAD(P)/FAD-dependent oxidoreductase [Parathalassolituus penaei]MCY0964233.1 NAD(P)/FAD-dependent oxidoreductase [Parathalassolituus penaei]